MIPTTVESAHEDAEDGDTANKHEYHINKRERYHPETSFSVNHT